MSFDSKKVPVINRVGFGLSLAASIVSFVFGINLVVWGIILSIRGEVVVNGVPTKISGEVGDAIGSSLIILAATFFIQSLFNISLLIFQPLSLSTAYKPIIVAYGSVSLGYIISLFKLLSYFTSNLVSCLAASMLISLLPAFIIYAHVRSLISDESIIKPYRLGTKSEAESAYSSIFINYRVQTDIIELEKRDKV